MNKLIVVLVTIPKDAAKKLSEVVLNERVCACVNILSGVESYFWWQGKIDHAEESLLIIKTTDTLFSKLEQIIKANHPYEVPEIVSIKADKVSKPYFQWLLAEVNAG